MMLHKMPALKKMQRTLVLHTTGKPTLKPSEAVKIIVYSLTGMEKYIFTGQQMIGILSMAKKFLAGIIINKMPA